MFKKPIPFKIYTIESGKLTSTGEHTHDYVQVWYIAGGHCEHTVGGNSGHVFQGNVFVIPPLVAHNIRITPGEYVKIIGCEFIFDFIDENIVSMDNVKALLDLARPISALVSGDTVRTGFILKGAVQSKVEELLYDMLAEYTGQNKYYEFNIKADLLKLLVILAREFEKPENPGNVNKLSDSCSYGDGIQTAIDYIEGNYSKPISLKDVCKISLMSQTYFSHFFKHVTGKTFTEYLNNLRIRKIMEMMEDREKSITEICFKSGFNSSTYFSKKFSRETGLSPKEFRKLYIKNN
jgi:AraC-like DNA-binding protein